MSNVDDLINDIHAAPHKAVIVVAGAGTQAMSWLLGIAGASRTVLEALVPYGRLSMIDFLGREPEQFVSPETAEDIARAAYRRGLRLREGDDDSPVIGVACTATIATDRTKRGDHRCCVSTWDASRVTTHNLVLDKGARERAGEEEVVSRLVINALARCAGIEDQLPLGLTENERPEIQTRPHPSPIRQLLAGDVGTVIVYPDGRMEADEPLCGALLSGSFSPLHYGHEQLAAAAAAMLSAEVVFELSVVNVDKPPLEEEEILRRLSQFAGKSRVALTRAETFRKKAELFPENTFVIGWDTAVRLIDPKYYGDEPSAMFQALAEIWAFGCRFLVAGREQEGTYHTLADIPIPEGFSHLFQEIPESRFRADISSTALRNRR